MHIFKYLVWRLADNFHFLLQGISVSLVIPLCKVLDSQCSTTFFLYISSVISIFFFLILRVFYANYILNLQLQYTWTNWNQYLFTDIEDGPAYAQLSVPVNGNLLTTNEEVFLCLELISWPRIVKSLIQAFYDQFFHYN